MHLLWVTLALAASGHAPPRHGLAPGRDRDHDGLSNRQELTAHTNPYRRDTDGDGWLDGEEVAWGSDPLDATAGPDDDVDGLYIIQETTAGTDPTNPDTDADGWLDGEEVAWGFDPLDAADHP